jgi:hypothetical protein
MDNKYEQQCPYSMNQMGAMNPYAMGMNPYMMNPYMNMMCCPLMYMMNPMMGANPYTMGTNPYMMNPMMGATNPYLNPTAETE